jgi:hypothetical protein
MNKENLIGEAVEAAAFITNEEGYDVAVLRRVIANEVTDEQHKLLTDDEWQSLVNLINAAPAMLDALRLALTCLDAAADGRLEDVKDEIGGTANIVDEVITKATK